MRLKSFLIIVNLLLLPLTVLAQFHLKNGTSITIESNTELNFTNSNGIITIDSNTIFINNGIVKIGSHVIIDEKKGFPISGNGYEQFDSTISATFTNLNIGGMGLILSGNNSGNISIHRFHTALTDSAGGFSVKRYFEFNALNLIVDSISITCDTTELNGNARNKLYVLGNNSDGYNNYSKKVELNDFVYSNINDSISLLTLAGYVLQIDSLNQYLFCSADTLISFYQIGGFENDGPFILQLSTINGDFSNAQNIDTSFIFNGELSYIIPSSITSSSNYHFRIKSQPLNLYSDTFQLASIYSNPAIPIISNIYDTLFCDLSGLNYQWYLNGAPISSANQQEIIVSQNGNYVVEVLNANGCNNYSDTFNYTFTSVQNFSLTKFNYFPNPTTSFFNIESDSEFAFKLYDISGKNILADKNPSLSKVIDVQPYSIGYYIGEIIFNEKEIIRIPIIKN